MGETYGHAHAAITHAAYICLRDKPTTHYTGGEWDAVGGCNMMCNQARELAGKPNGRTSTGIAILRDIFGNPFRPVAFDPRWRSSDTVGVARGIYEDRAFERMPILADALMDAGCDDEQVLGHCRGEGPHVRGCWVVDLILDKK